MSAWPDFEFDWKDPAAAGGAAAEEEETLAMPNWGDSSDNNDNTTNDTQQQQQQVVEGTSEFEQQRDLDEGAPIYQQEEAQALPVQENLNPSFAAPAGIKMEEYNADFPADSVVFS